MPVSPQTPRHSPHPSMDYQSGAAGYSPQSERRQSKSSFHEPSTPLRGSFNPSDNNMDNMFSSGGMGGMGNGLGNLADELGDAFDDDDGGFYYGDEIEGIDGMAPPEDDDEDEDEMDVSVMKESTTRDSGVDVSNQSPTKAGLALPHRASLSLPSPNGKGHRRMQSEYDGSEYGSESDLESSGMPPRLVEMLDRVASLARRGAENNGSATDGVFKRVTDGLQDLGSQAGVEGGATRLITAHSALTTHLSHQTRQLHNLVFPLLSPLVAPPDPEMIDTLLPMFDQLVECMPRPSTNAFQSLAALHTISADLADTLNYLSDTLHMSRQTTTTATRRLRSAKELVAEMKKEDELREEGERWITRGNWEERLQKRECASVCGDVVGGFEEVCNGWRKRLLAQVETTTAQG
ncbi:hypothetical protein QBC46DRAFT_287612 [Diplogelasinospora grovesii]|uniref:Uncharacterized protein n=1 Tax=Diplogelasinospora grovesii TaxID=303347 RepID=A0AAN6NBF5_9PEZI|nr:hypothetical protein QBC46DRAFT_287612 [Diplogelasinospora grovesii]